jgi:hypothetical protein
VLVLQTVVKTSSALLSAWARGVLKLGPLWGFRGVERLYVVSGSISDVRQEVRDAILMGPDADAANECIAALRFLRPRTRVVRMYSPSFPDEMLKENVVAVGGPVNNPVTEKVMQPLSRIVKFDAALILHDLLAGSQFETKYSDGNTVERDYGLILKLPNPMRIGGELLVLAGCDTHGVLAAARAISPHPDGTGTSHAIRAQLGFGAFARKDYYMAVVSCNAVGNEVGTLQLVAFHRLFVQNGIVKGKGKQ